jgi:death-on-curing family protein
MLGARYVEYIHDELLEVFWPASEDVASKGVRDRSLLESAVGRPFQSAFGQDVYPTTVEKGAALFHSLIGNHAFVDGNKRTAVTVFDHFLLANGLVLGIPNSAMHDIATNTAHYRARNISHEESMRAILDATGGLITSIATFKKELTGVRGLDVSIAATISLRRWIRKHPFNRLVDSD